MYVSRSLTSKRAFDKTADKTDQAIWGKQQKTDILMLHQYQSIKVNLDSGKFSLESRQRQNRSNQMLSRDSSFSTTNGNHLEFYGAHVQ